MLGGLSAQEFLGRHWQKEPRLIRGAFPGDALPLGREDVEALARNPSVSSRLVTGPVGGWSVRRGPFEPGDLARLPPEGWTLLVQEADRHLASCAALLERFRFVPNWRVDDVMVSYATDGGGVGPHVDRYDVFLVQAGGRRRWRIGREPDADPRLRPGTELPILAGFRHDDEWILEPGDMLYLPPGIPHDGVAVGECVTCSVGFRVPDPRELGAGYLRRLAPAVLEQIRYADPGLRVPTRLGEIPEDARRRMRDSVRDLFDGQGFDRWLGCLCTQPLRGDGPDGQGPEVVERVRAGLGDDEVLRRSAPAHFAWYRDAGGSVELFVGGERYPLGRDLEAPAELLCGRDPLDAAAVRSLMADPQLAAITSDLILRGYLRTGTWGQA